MKKFKKQAFVAIGGLTLIMNAGVASSSIPQASASIDWNTFTITGYGLGTGAAPTYSLSGLSSNTSSNVSDWFNWSADTTNNAHLFAASTEGNTAGTGSASATRNANINVSGTGFLWITANYQLNAAINPNTDAGYYGAIDQNSASATINASLTNNSSVITSGSSTFQASINLGNPWLWPLNNLSFDQNQGIMSLGVIVNDGDILNFSSSVNVTAHDNGLTLESPQAIPVPAAVWLFGSALLGFIGLDRRRQTVR